MEKVYAAETATSLLNPPLGPKSPFFTLPAQADFGNPPKFGTTSHTPDRPPLDSHTSDLWDSHVLQPGRLFKSGNSLAIRIPTAIAKHADVHDGTAVEMTADGGVILVRKPHVTLLQDLIERITPENMHAPEFDGLGPQVTAFAREIA